MEAWGGKWYRDHALIPDLRGGIEALLFICGAGCVAGSRDIIHIQDSFSDIVKGEVRKERDCRQGHT